MSTNAFQRELGAASAGAGGCAFQFGPNAAFQSQQTVSPASALGVKDSLAASARATLKAPSSYALRVTFSAPFGGIVASYTPVAGPAAVKATWSAGLKGTVAATAAGSLAAAATLAERSGQGASAARVTSVAVDLLALRASLAGAHKATRLGAATLAANLAGVSLGSRNFKVAISFGLSAALVDRQQFISPKALASVSRFAFQHRISHRGGHGWKHLARPARQVEPERWPLSFAEALNRPPPPFELPAPHLVRHSVHDLRPAPTYKPPAVDVLAVDRAIADALDHRDAFAMLEALLDQEEAAREAEDERDVAELLSRIV